VCAKAFEWPAELPDETPMPACFELLRLAISQVELLELIGYPHRRRRWQLDQQWRELDLNP